MGFHFGRKKEEEEQPKGYDPSRQRPVVRCSICNGEQVAGFKDLETGKFEEVMFLKDQHDLEEFKMKYGVTEVTREY